LHVDIKSSVSESYNSDNSTESVIKPSLIQPTPSQSLLVPSSSMELVTSPRDKEAVDLCKNYETIVGDSRISKPITASAI